LNAQILRGLYYKTFYGTISCLLLKARVFVTAIHFSPGIIFSDKARSLPLELSPLRGFLSWAEALPANIRLGRSVTGSGKHSSLLRYGNNYGCKKFYSIRIPLSDASHI
jgi:hypothetical protein